MQFRNDPAATEASLTARAQLGAIQFNSCRVIFGRPEMGTDHSYDWPRMLIGPQIRAVVAALGNRDFGRRVFSSQHSREELEAYTKMEDSPQKDLAMDGHSFACGFPSIRSGEVVRRRVLLTGRTSAYATPRRESGPVMASGSMPAA